MLLINRRERRTSRSFTWRYQKFLVLSSYVSLKFLVYFKSPIRARRSALNRVKASIAQGAKQSHVPSIGIPFMSLVAYKHQAMQVEAGKEMHAKL